MLRTIKLCTIPLAIILLCSAVPISANALLLKNSGAEGMFLPVPRQLFPTSFHGMSTSMPDPNSIQVSPHSNLTSTPIQTTTSHPTMNTSISNPNNVQFLPSSSSNTAWPNRTPFGSFLHIPKNFPIFAVAPFLNIPKNLIVPPACGVANSSQVCPAIVGTQRGDIIIATAVNNARIFGLGGNDIIECGTGQCNVFTAFGNNVIMSGGSLIAHLFAGSGGPGPGNNIFIGGGGLTLMVGGNGNDQFFAGSNNLFDGGNDIMIGGSGANYFDCGPNGNGIILDFNPAKGDSKAPNCKYVITTYSNNIFGPGIPDNLTGVFSSVRPNIAALIGLLSGQNSNANQVNNTAASGLLAGAGPMGLLSGQYLNANHPNNAGPMRLLSGQYLNANQPNNAGPMGLLSGGKAGVMGKGYP